MDNLIEQVKLTKLEMSDFTEQERIDIIKLKSDLIALPEKELIEKYASTDKDFTNTVDTLYNMYDSGNLTFLLISDLEYVKEFKMYKMKNLTNKFLVLINARRFDIKNKKEVYPKINDLITFYNRTEYMDKLERSTRCIDLLYDDTIERDTKIPGFEEYLELLVEDGKVIDFLTTNKDQYNDENISETICSISFLNDKLPMTFETDMVKENLKKIEQIIMNNEEYSLYKNQYELVKQYIKK